jgi:sulfite exporter TauE/SafE
LEIIFVAFITGITTGGLSCLAVQGGLLASSLAGQIEKDLQKPTPKTGRKRQGTHNRAKQQVKLARPILAFLIAKILAYTLLGFLLGWVGQMFQLSLYARAFLQIAIGIFMFGSALRMLNVHPIFRYFAFEPPAFLRRKLRKTAAEAASSSPATPVFLGFMTVLIPCGVTQAMMAVALGTGNPLQGAALMFAFTLGTSPVFFAVAYFATRLGSKLERHFMRFVAVIVLLLAVVTIDSGITMAGSPYSLTRMVTGVFTPRDTVLAAEPREGLQTYATLASVTTGKKGTVPGDTAVTGENVVTINVMNYGYEPEVVHVKAGVPIKLRLVSDEVRSCSRAFIIPAMNVEEILAETGETVVDLPPQEKGARVPFSCSMGMYGGTMIFDL